MTWDERNLMDAYTTVRLVRTALDKVVSEMDQDKFPTAFGLVKAAERASWLADQELHSLVVDKTERIAK